MLNISSILTAVILGAVLATAACKSDLKVTTQDVGAVEDCATGGDGMDCVGEAELSLLQETALTNDPNFTVRWSARGAIDHAAGFRLDLASDATCATAVLSFTNILELQKPLTSIADGNYFLCLYGKKN